MRISARPSSWGFVLVAFSSFLVVFLWFSSVISEQRDRAAANATAIEQERAARTENVAIQSALLSGELDSATTQLERANDEISKAILAGDSDQAQRLSGVRDALQTTIDETRSSAALARAQQAERASSALAKAQQALGVAIFDVDDQVRVSRLALQTAVTGLNQKVDGVTADVLARDTARMTAISGVTVDVSVRDAARLAAIAGILARLELAEASLAKGATAVASLGTKIAALEVWQAAVDLRIGELSAADAAAVEKLVILSDRITRSNGSISETNARVTSLAAQVAALAADLAALRVSLSTTTTTTTVPVTTTTTAATIPATTTTSTTTSIPVTTTTVVVTTTVTTAAVGPAP